MSDGVASAPSKKRGKIIALIVVVLLVVLGVASFFIDRSILSQTYARTPVAEANLLPVYEDYADTYPREAVEFTLGDKTLRGYVYGPENTRGLIVFRHGITSYHQDYLAMILAMVDKGWRVFAYDAIGCGESDGDDVIGLSQSPIDVDAAVSFARESGMADGMEIALWGHSWGGYGVAAALESQPDVAACVTMSGFDAPMKVFEASSQNMMGVLGLTQMPTMWLNTALVFGVDCNRSASKAIIDSGVPTLIVHGSADAVVPYEGVSILSNATAGGVVPENVETLVFSEDGRNGHNTYFYSRESQEYLNECGEKLNRILEENGGDSTAPEVTAYLASVDKMKANTANPELIDRVDSFLSLHM